MKDQESIWQVKASVCRPPCLLCREGRTLKSFVSLYAKNNEGVGSGASATVLSKEKTFIEKLASLSLLMLKWQHPISSEWLASLSQWVSAASQQSSSGSDGGMNSPACTL